jgi:hypothetical protein
MWLWKENAIVLVGQGDSGHRGDHHNRHLALHDPDAEQSNHGKPKGGSLVRHG